MTTKKNHHYVAIAGLVFFLAAGIGFWFVPFHKSGNAFLDSDFVKFAIRFIASIACIGGITDLLNIIRRKDNDNG